MKKGSFFRRFIVIILVIVGVLTVLKWATNKWVGAEEEKVTGQAILHLELNGVILNGKKFLKHLKKYSEEEAVKAVVIEINSPGGAVGPSQEIYMAIKKVRDELKKPVVCVSSGVVASGAYYSALGCNKLIVAPGSMIGSIGVIMEFINLEKLYEWAKVSRYTVTSGKFKDSGNEFRAMRDDEKALFKDMIDEVYQQFRGAVRTERKLSEEVLDQYADGRVFTGVKAVEKGFADSVGLWEQAVDEAAKMAKLGDNYEIFEVPKKKVSIFDLGEREDLDSINSLREMADATSLTAKSKGMAQEAVKTLLRAEYLNQPLYLLPGTW